MPTPQLRIRPCVLLASAAILGAAVVARVLLEGDMACDAAVVLAIAVVTAAVGFVDLLPRAPWAGVGVQAKIGGAILLALGAIVPLKMGVAYGPVAVAMALGPLPLYLWPALRIDRGVREPRRFVVFAFLWGACAAASLGAILNDLGASVVGSALGAHAAAVYENSISAPVVEECAKAAVLVIIYRRFRGEFNGVLDGIVYATMVGLGFAATENIVYYGSAWADGGMLSAVTEFVARGIFTPFLHPLITAMTGVGLGIASRSDRRSRRVAASLLGLGAAVVLHSLVDTSLLVGDLAEAVNLFLIDVPLFIGMLFFIRRTLKAERQTIGRHLADDVQEGRLTRAEVDVLVSGRARRRALKAAKRAGGKQSRGLLAAFHRAAGELALLREGLAQGRLARDAHIADRHERYQARVSELRGQLGAMALSCDVVAERHGARTERLLPQVAT